jgi:transcriptional regulator with XRE-family HTH domain/Tol biopolymer transport system component
MKQIRVLRLRHERERRGWSRNYIAEQIEVDMITVGRWERGERMPHPQYRQKLCALFEMSAQELGLFSEPEEPSIIAHPPPEPEAQSDTEEVVGDPSPAPEVLTAMLTAPDPAQKVLSIKKEAIQRSTPVMHRRKLIIGLAGLGIVTLTGSSLLLTAHTSPTPEHITAPTKLPQASLSHQLFDPGLNNWTNRVAWSPDGRKIAAASGKNVVSIWSLEKAALMGYYSTLNEWVNDVSWAKDNWIAAANGGLHGGSLQVWKFPAEKPTFILQRPYSVRAVSWSPDGKYLAFAGHATTAEVWNPFTARQVSTYSCPNLGMLGINSVRWSATGALLACSADDGTVHVWEALTGKVRRIYHGHQYRVHDLAWSPDERYIVSAGADKTVQVWDALTGHTLLVYQKHTDEIEGVDWSPQGKYIASGGKDLTVQVWEAFTGKQIASYHTRKNSPVEGVHWSINGKMVAAATDTQGIEIWQAPVV